MKKIAILGSTGSIGRHTCEVVYSHKEMYQISGLAAGTNLAELAKQVKIFNPIMVSVKSKEYANHFKEISPQTKIVYGNEGLNELITETNPDYIMIAINGTDAIGSIFHSIHLNKRICLANKECLVVGGRLINAEIEKSNSEIIPVDSEQSAIFQCLKDSPISEVNKIILTASGGPFFKRNKNDFTSISLQEALSHPIWKMGKKITIDSATLMNKALEIIETHFLFHIPKEKINVIIHPQSVIHSMVEFVDHSILAQMSIPDMKIPILYSLTYPARMMNRDRSLSLTALKNLEFIEVDFNKFPSINHAYFVIEEGKNSGAVFNTANEVAVEFFLKNKLSFAQIFSLVDAIMNKSNFHEIGTLNDIYDTIKETREKCLDWIKGEIGSW